MMEFNSNADFNQLTIWLDQNLKDENRIKACCQNAHNVPLKKGIYFWFLNRTNYQELSNNIVINPIEPRYQKVINNEVYDLVYLGTAGVRNNSNGVNNGNLQERLKWHLCNNKGVSALCNGTMSTFRRTIGGLISSDLIENGTQDKIDEILCSFFYVYYISYEGTFLEVKDTINQIETKLINSLRPIFNLDQNPNASNPNHVTYNIDKRRKKIQTLSRNKWVNIDKTKVETKNYKKPSKVNNSILTSDKNVGCFEFKVLQNQSAFELIRNYEFKAKNYTIDIFESIKPNNYICTYYDKTSIPNKYFGNTDTNKERLIDNKEPARWKVIQKTMIQNNIQEITIRLCPLINLNNKTMITNCLLEKIANATGKLQPTILRAILNLYTQGLHLITSRDVRDECENMDDDVSWGGRIPAICNAMRNATECGFHIVGGNEVSNNFTISIDKNSINTDLPKVHKISKEKSPKGKVGTTVPPINSGNDLINNLDWDKIKDKNKKKLLIISCSNSKNIGGNIIPGNNYFNNPDLYDNLINDRIARNAQYIQLINGNPDYFIINRNGLGEVNADYFNQQLLDPLYMPAFERYNGIFYTPQLRNLYIKKKQESNLHILIISGLYGVLEFTDSIIDYHIKIDNIPLWTQPNSYSILEAVKKYIKVNDISNEMVFYSLSNPYNNALNPIVEWTNLWIPVGRGHVSARFLEYKFLPSL